MATYYVDERTETIGKFVGYDGPNSYLLQPMGGGREWACPKTDTHPASLEEKIRAQLSVENARSQARPTAA